MPYGLITNLPRPLGRRSKKSVALSNVLEIPKASSAQKQRGNRSTKSLSSRTDQGSKANTASDTAGPGQQQPAPQILHQGSLPTPSAHLLEAISLLRTFKKYPDNMKNLPKEGGLPSQTKATKGQSPGTHRPAIRGTNSRSRDYFPITPENLYTGLEKPSHRPNA